MIDVETKDDINSESVEYSNDKHDISNSPHNLINSTNNTTESTNMINTTTPTNTNTTNTTNTMIKTPSPQKHIKSMNTNTPKSKSSKKTKSPKSKGTTPSLIRASILINNPNTDLKQLQKAESKAIKYKQKLEQYMHQTSLQKQQQIKENIILWEEKVLPNYLTFYETNFQFLSQLCWKGIPSKMREKVWPLLIGNKLKLDENYYASLKIQIELHKVNQMATKKGQLTNSRLSIVSTSSQRNSITPMSKHQGAAHLTPIQERRSSLDSNTPWDLGMRGKHDYEYLERNGLLANETISNKIHESGYAHDRISMTHRNSYENSYSHMLSPKTRKKYTPTPNGKNSTDRISLTNTPASSNITPFQETNVSLQVPTVSSIYENDDIRQSMQQEDDGEDHFELDYDDYDRDTMTRESFLASMHFPMLSQAPETIALIEFDLPRTFPTLGFFHNNGPLQESLENILQAFAYHKPEVGYVQGMSYLAAMLLLFIDEIQAFLSLANLLDQRNNLDFYGLQRESIDAYVATFDYFFQRYLPLLYDHMKEQAVTSEMFLLDWHLSLFAKALSLEAVARIWDIYLLEGELFLLRTGLGLLRLFAPKIRLLGLEKIMGFLMHLEDKVDIDELLSSIQQITITEKQFQTKREMFIKQFRGNSENTTSNVSKKDSKCRIS